MSTRHLITIPVTTRLTTTVTTAHVITAAIAPITTVGMVITVDMAITEVDIMAVDFTVATVNHGVNG